MEDADSYNTYISYEYSRICNLKFEVCNKMTGWCQKCKDTLGINFDWSR